MQRRNSWLTKTLSASLEWMASIPASQFNGLKDEKNKDTLAYAIEKCLAQTFTLGKAPEMKNMKNEIHATMRDFSHEMKIQENLKIAKNEQGRQKDRSLDYSF